MIIKNSNNIFKILWPNYQIIKNNLKYLTYKKFIIMLLLILFIFILIKNCNYYYWLTVYKWSHIILKG